MYLMDQVLIQKQILQNFKIGIVIDVLLMNMDIIWMAVIVYNALINIINVLVLQQEFSVKDTIDLL